MSISQTAVISRMSPLDGDKFSFNRRTPSHGHGSKFRKTMRVIQKSLIVALCGLASITHASAKQGFDLKQQKLFKQLLEKQKDDVTALGKDLRSDKYEQACRKISKEHDHAYLAQVEETMLQEKFKTIIQDIEKIKIDKLIVKGDKSSVYEEIRDIFRKAFKFTCKIPYTTLGRIMIKRKKDTIRWKFKKQMKDQWQKHLSFGSVPFKKGDEVESYYYHDGKLSSLAFYGTIEQVNPLQAGQFVGVTETGLRAKLLGQKSDGLWQVQYFEGDKGLAIRDKKASDLTAETKALKIRFSDSLSKRDVGSLPNWLRSNRFQIVQKDKCFVRRLGRKFTELSTLQFALKAEGLSQDAALCKRIEIL